MPRARRRRLARARRKSRKSFADVLTYVKNVRTQTAAFKKAVTNLKIRL